MTEMQGVERPVSTIDPNLVVLPHLVGDMDLVCDWADEPYWCPAEPARWVMFRVPCVCGAGGASLACGPCKELRLTTVGGVACRQCGEVFIPAREAYSHIEPLDKKP